MFPILRLNPDLNLASLATAFAKSQRLRIENVLTSETAELIARCLENETPFDIALLDSKGSPLVLSDQQLDWGDPQIASARARAGSGFSFVYRSFPMLTAYQQHRLPGHLLHRVLEFLNSSELLDLFQQVTGHSDIARADAQATLYEPGCFLTTHNDLGASHHRRAAYVLGFTRVWRLDWGGLLLFHDEQGRVFEGLSPGFNTLDLFTVPQLHSVSSVAPFAQSGRYTITGWARAMG